MIFGFLVIAATSFCDNVCADSGQGANPVNYYRQSYPHQGATNPNDPRAYYQPQTVVEQWPLDKIESEELTETKDKLPDGWLEYLDPASGKPYYYNVVDRTTTWTRPKPVPIEVHETSEKSEGSSHLPLQSSQVEQKGDSITASLDKDYEGSGKHQLEQPIASQQDYAIGDLGAKKPGQYGDTSLPPLTSSDFDDQRESYDSWGANSQSNLQQQDWRRSDIVSPVEQRQQATSSSAQIQSQSNEEMTASKQQGLETQHIREQTVIQAQRPAHEDGYHPFHPTRPDIEQQRMGPNPSQQQYTHNYPPQQSWDPYPSPRENQQQTSPQRPQQPPTWTAPHDANRVQHDPQRKLIPSYNEQDQLAGEETRKEVLHHPRESWDNTQQIKSVVQTGQQTKAQIESKPKIEPEPPSTLQIPIPSSVDQPHSSSKAPDGFRDTTHQRPPHPEHAQYYPHPTPPGWYSASPYGPQGQGQGQVQQQHYPYNNGPYGIPSQQGRPGNFGMPPQGYRGEQMGNMPISPRGQQQPQLSGQVVSQTGSTTSAVKEALGSAWQGFLGFGSKTKELVGQAKDSVVQSTSQVGDAVSVTSVGTFFPVDWFYLYPSHLFS